MKQFSCQSYSLDVIVLQWCVYVDTRLVSGIWDHCSQFHAISSVGRHCVLCAWCVCVQGRRVSVQGCWCVGMYVCVQRKRTQHLDTKRESLHDTHLSARKKRLLRWTEGMTSVFSSNPHTSIILIWTRGPATWSSAWFLSGSGFVSRLPEYAWCNAAMARSGSSGTCLPALPAILCLIFSLSVARSVLFLKFAFGQRLDYCVMYVQPLVS